LKVFETRLQDELLWVEKEEGVVPGRLLLSLFDAVDLSREQTRVISIYYYIWTSFESLFDAVDLFV